MSASALEDYAKCPFRFFVRRVLKATPVTEGGEDLDPLASGRLHHAVLERFFLNRRDCGRLPLRGDADDRAAMDQAVDEELRRFHGKERTGHPELLKVRVRRLRADLLRLLAREASSPIDPDCVPARFEHRFGPLALRGTDDGDGDGDGDTDGAGMALHIEGIIDRVDLGRGRAVVLDYKAGRLLRYEELLRSHLLETSFQLPLYAAALTVDESLRDGGPPITEVSARYYSLRQGRVSKPLQDAEMISLDPAVRRRVPDRNVAEVAYRLWRRLRAGDFRVAPRTCEGCGLESSCRIPAASAAFTEPGDEPGDGAAPSSSTTNRPPAGAASPTPDWQP
ncbi:MAG TPA: PD-(D/E)XK nuclease family protein [Pseudomonadota bacterium]|nr:PD-(D/E)XK nuclease family protein [Pseudomonadota bacterium]